MDYRDFRQPSRPAPTQLDPDPDKAPALAVFVNFPPDPNPVHVDVLALYCPVFTMFETPSKFKDAIIDQYSPGSGHTRLPFTAYKESILGWFPNSLGGPYSLKDVGLTDNRLLYVRNFLLAAMQFGIVHPAVYPRPFTYYDEGVSKGEGHSKSECFVNALGSDDYLVFKAATEGALRDENTEVVKGLIKAMWRLKVNGAGRLAGPIVGGILEVSQKINFQTNESALSTKGLAPPPGSNLSPTDYVAEISKQIIVNAGRVNTLLNLVEDFRVVGPDGPQVIPPKLKIEIGGHTDRVGTEKINFPLSEERAKAVVKFLVDNRDKIVAFTGRDDTQDFITSRLIAKGYGPSQCSFPDNGPHPEARKVTFRIKNG